MNTSMIRLLFIEDNPADALLVREMLDAAQHMGWHLPRCEIKHVVRLQEGLDCLENETFDVVLSDLDLPDSRAGETVTTLRAHIPRMPLVVLTGREDEVLAHQSVRAGVQDYLYKDEATGSVLVRSLMYAIERQQAHAELEQRVEERTADLRQTNEELQAEITAHKRTVEVLRRERDLLARITETSPVGITIVDCGGQITFANNRAEEVLGLTKDQITQRAYNEPAWRITDYEGNSFPEAELPFEQVMNTGQAVYDVRHAIEWPDGRRVLLSINAAPLFDDTHQLNGMVSALVDVTRQVQAEERIKHLNRVLRTISNVNQLIIKETDRGRLIQGVCDKLTETRGYHNAWIALLEDAGESVTAFESGLGADFAALREQLQRGELNACGQQALSQSEVVATEDPASTCTDCPLAASYAGRGAMTVRLEHDGDVYGLLTVSVPAHFTMDEEERSLFQEVAGDVAFALHGIELEKKRKQAEEALRESEERYRTLIQNIHAGVVVHGADSQIITCNRKAQELLGLTENQILGAEASDPVWRFLREDGTPMRLAEYPVNQVLNIRQPLRDLILGVIWPGENDVTWNTVSADPIFDAAGDITEVIVSFMDITARKRAADALQASESRFRSLFENSPIAYQSLNEDGRYIDVNHRLCELLGYSRDELMGKKFGEFWSERTQHRFPEAFEGFKCSGAVTGELELVHKDGSLLTVVLEGRTQRDLDGNFVRTHCILHNITARKQTEEALRQTARRLQALLDHSPALVHIFDEEGRYLLVGEATAEAMGMAREEIIGKTFADLLPPETVATLMRRVEALREDRAVLSVEDQITVNGEERFFESLLFPLSEEDGVSTYAAIATDVTARKQAEEALRESEARFRGVFETSPTGIAIVDAATQGFTEANDSLLDILGYSLEELQQLTVGDVTHPEDWEREAEFVQAYLDGELPSYEVEKRYIRKDGEIRWVRTTGDVLLVDPDDSPLAIANVEDITERKRAEETLRESEKRFHTVSELVSDYAYAVHVEEDGSLTIEWATEGFTQDTGLKLSRKIADAHNNLAIYPDDAPILRQRMQTLLSNQEDMSEYRIVTTSGEVRWLRDYGHPIWDDAAGRVVRIIGAAQDITARKRAEGALRTRLRYEKNLARLSQVLLEDSEAEDVVAKALGYLRDASGAARIYMFENFVDDGDSLCMRQTHESCAPGVESQLDNPILQHVPYAEGFERWVTTLSQGEPIRGPVDTFPPEEHAVLEPQEIRSILVLPIEVGRRWQGFIGFDETRFVREWQDKDVRLLQTAAEIIGSYFRRKQMEEKVKDYAAELERSNEELEQFAYVISHDLREPARMVKSYLELLESRYQGQLDEKAEKYVDYAVDGAERMQEMISALLDLSRIGRRGKEPAPTDAEAVLERTLRSLGRAIEEAEAEVTHDPLPTVMADRAQLAQVFQNLIANAIKFRREDAPPRVHVSAEREGDQWLFSIRDNGIGIDPKQADRIFQIFQRLHTREEYEGTGIGLALCKRIVERHGGRIWVESAVGEGSTFYFTLPA